MKKIAFVDNADSPSRRMPSCAEGSSSTIPPPCALAIQHTKRPLLNGTASSSATCVTETDKAAIYGAWIPVESESGTSVAAEGGPLSNVGECAPPVGHTMTATVKFHVQVAVPPPEG
jgi:hypothetical protein